MELVMRTAIHVIATRKWFLTLPLGLLGFVPIVNVTVPNPSIFPDGRLLDSAPRLGVFLYQPSRLIYLPRIGTYCTITTKGSLFLKFSLTEMTEKITRS
jgi:hypothetical protein